MERTRSLTSNYYRNSHAVIFVYAVDENVLTDCVAELYRGFK